MDQIKFHETIDLLAEEAVNANEEFYTLINTFSHSTNDYENMAARIAIPEKKSVIVTQNEGKFSGHDPSVGMGRVESMIFEDSNLIVQPLIFEGNILLEAAYPPNLKPHIEETLKKIVVNSKKYWNQTQIYYLY